MGAENRITNLQERIKNGGKDNRQIDQTDRENLLGFDRRLSLLTKEYTAHRREKLPRHCTIIAERLDHGLLTAAVGDRDAAEEIIRWINDTYENEETNLDYRVALRVFGRRIAESDDSIETNTDGHPEGTTWIPTNTSSDYDPTPDPREYAPVGGGDQTYD